MDRIAIFGAGYQATVDYYTLREKYNIMYILDNDRTKRQFYGKKVVTPDERNVRKHFIVVCTNEANYLGIARQLKSYGLVEFKDFCPSRSIGKKIVIVHGNCHMAILKEYMMSSEQFEGQYYIYPLPLIMDLSEVRGESRIEDELLETCDVFIHQDIRVDNCYGEKVSDAYLIPRLSVKCKNITVPNLFNNFGKAFFPQQVQNSDNPVNGIAIKGMFPHGDENVKKLLSGGGAQYRRNFDGIKRRYI